MSTILLNNNWTIEPIYRHLKDGKICPQKFYIPPNITMEKPYRRRFDYYDSKTALVKHIKLMEDIDEKRSNVKIKDMYYVKEFIICNDLLHKENKQQTKKSINTDNAILNIA